MLYFLSLTLTLRIQHFLPLSIRVELYLPTLLDVVGSLVDPIFTFLLQIWKKKLSTTEEI